MLSKGGAFGGWNSWNLKIRDDLVPLFPTNLRDLYLGPPTTQHIGLSYQNTGRVWVL